MKEAFQSCKNFFFFLFSSLISFIFSHFFSFFTQSFFFFFYHFMKERSIMGKIGMNMVIASYDFWEWYTILNCQHDRIIAWHNQTIRRTLRLPKSRLSVIYLHKIGTKTSVYQNVKIEIQNKWRLMAVNDSFQTYPNPRKKALCFPRFC